MYICGVALSYLTKPCLFFFTNQSGSSIKTKLLRGQSRTRSFGWTPLSWSQQMFDTWCAIKHKTRVIKLFPSRLPSLYQRDPQILDLTSICKTPHNKLTNLESPKAESETGSGDKAKYLILLSVITVLYFVMFKQ